MPSLHTLLHTFFSARVHHQEGAWSRFSIASPIPYHATPREPCISLFPEVNQRLQGCVEDMMSQSYQSQLTRISVYCQHAHGISPNPRCDQSGTHTWASSSPVHGQ